MRQRTFKLAEARGKRQDAVSSHGHSQASWISLGMLALLAMLGVALRLRQYLFDRSLWADEVALALNVINRDLVSLLTAPLDDNQSAPPGFLLITRFSVVGLGPGELSLRLTPLIAGLLVVLMAFVLARRELKSTAAQVTFVGLTALSPVLIFYSSEFKQYSSDALIALSMVVAVAYRTSRYGSTLLAIVGFVGIISSLPAVFLAVPAALLILYEATRSSRWQQAIAVGVAWSAGAALHAAYYLQAGVDRESMVRWWGKWGTFAPFPPSSVAEFLWYPRSISSLTYVAFRELEHAFPGVRAGWFDPLGWLLALALVFALVAIVGSRRWTGIVAAGAILTTLLAAAVEIYPFSSRLLIFLVPLTLFIIAAGIDELRRISGQFAAVTAAVLLFSVVVPAAAEVARKPRFYSNMRGALEMVERGFEDGDAIAVWITDNLFAYYGHTLTARGAPVFKLKRGDHASSLIESAEKKGYRRVWFVAAHRARLARNLIKEAARRAPILFEWSTHGTRVVLLDFAAR